MRSPFQRKPAIQDPPRVCRTPRPQVIPIDFYTILQCTLSTPDDPPTGGFTADFTLEIHINGQLPGSLLSLDWHPPAFGPAFIGDSTPTPFSQHLDTPDQTVYASVTYGLGIFAANVFWRLKPIIATAP